MVVHDTPLGKLRILAGPRGLRSIGWPREEGSVQEDLFALDTGARIIEELCRSCLDAYFSKQWVHFRQLRERIPLDLLGTPFQRRVWAVLYALPRTTFSYTDIAGLAGHPRAARAVGSACALNPIPILVPCHRVLACDGPGGYSGGAQRKEWLLSHEEDSLPLAAPLGFSPPAELASPSRILSQSELPER